MSAFLQVDFSRTFLTTFSEFSHISPIESPYPNGTDLPGEEGL